MVGPKVPIMLVPSVYFLSCDVFFLMMFVNCRQHLRHAYWHHPHSYILVAVSYSSRWLHFGEFRALLMWYLSVCVTCSLQQYWRCYWEFLHFDTSEKINPEGTQVMV